MSALIQPSFARGEIAPSIYGRVDTAAFAAGLRVAWNVIIHAYGGASNRPGLEWVAPVADHTYTPRLIPFKFKTTDTYMLEFGDLYMRVLRGDSHVVETAVAITGITNADPGVVTAVAHGYSNGEEIALSGILGMLEANTLRVIAANVTANTFEMTDQVTGANIDTTLWGAYTSGGEAARVFEIATPYAVADLGNIKYTQSADVMTLVHPSYDTYELSRTAHDAWTLAAIDFQPDQATPTALTATQNGTTGSAEYRYAVTAVAEETFEESLTAPSVDAATITGATQANPVVITFSAGSFVFKEGDWIEITGVVGMTELNGRRFKLRDPTATTAKLDGEDGTAYAAYVSDGMARPMFQLLVNGNATLSAVNNILVSWASAAGAQLYNVYKESNGFYGLLGQTESTSFKDDGSIITDLDISPPRVREPFRYTDDKPGAVGYHEQRRVFGGSNNMPDTSNYSRVADYANFTFSIPLRADDAILATLTSLEVNEIRHYVPLNDLIVLTSGEEWRVDSGDNNRFSADTIRQKPQSRWGSSHHRPVVFGNVILFVQDNDAIIRSLGFEFTVDSYTGTDLTLLANHIFKDNFVADWSAVTAPDPIVYIVRDDGRAVAFTFDQEQKVIAFARWGTRTPDKFEAVATVRPSQHTGHGALYDAAYFVVKRTINGNTVRYIEHVHDRYVKDVQDAFFVDSGLTYDAPIAISGATAASPVVLTVPTGHGLVVDDEVDISDIEWVPNVDSLDNETQPAQLNGGRFKVKASAATTISLKDAVSDADIDGTAYNAYVESGYVRKAVTKLYGYHHLAGESVIALCDGSVVRDLSVGSDGTVTLPRAFSRIHLGFGYYSDLSTLNITVGGSRGDSDALQGRRKNVHQLIVRFERSRGLWAGPSETKLTEMSQRLAEPYGVPTQLFTGDVKIDILPSWNTSGSVVMRQRDPLPMTILAVVPQFETEGTQEE